MLDLHGLGRGLESADVQVLGTFLLREAGEVLLEARILRPDGSRLDQARLQALIEDDGLEKISIHVDSTQRGREEWSESDRRLLTWASTEVATAFARAYALEAAERGAKIDVLTGLPNRRYFDEVLAIERPRRRANDSLGILMIDIDHFKILNDRFGHATGDRVLRAVAGAIAQGVRAEDTPARYGGEEFAVLLRRTSAEQAVEVGERIRRAVVRLHPASLGIDEPVTVSVGVAVAGKDQVAIPGLVERADQLCHNVVVCDQLFKTSGLKVDAKRSKYLFAMCLFVAHLVGSNKQAPHCFV